MDLSVPKPSNPAKEKKSDRKRGEMTKENKKSRSLGCRKSNRNNNRKPTLLLSNSATVVISPTTNPGTSKKQQEKEVGKKDRKKRQLAFKKSVLHSRVIFINTCRGRGQPIISPPPPSPLLLLLLPAIPAHPDAPSLPVRQQKTSDTHTHKRAHAATATNNNARNPEEVENMREYG